jgi:hypothetical protein
MLVDLDVMRRKDGEKDPRCTPDLRDPLVSLRPPSTINSSTASSV